MRFRQLLRSLARMPLFTGITVLTLALGIGANTAIFSVIEGVLLKPLPYPRSDELVTLDHAAPGVNLPSAGAAPFQYFTYREEGRVFQDVGLWGTGTVSITGRAEPEEVPTLFATDGVLPMLGVQPMLGRLFSKADDTPATPETVVLTAGYWRSKFGSDNAVVGKSLMVDSKPREIIGVLPDTFRFLDRRVSLVVPYRFDRSKVFLGNFSYTAIARLKPGTTVAQANAEVARLIPISLTKFPPFPGGNVKMFEEARITPKVMTLKDDLVGDVQTVLWVLMGTIAVVLLIACANVANLLLVRAESRQQELAIRAALGAGTGRIAREMLFESVSLALLGGIVGTGTRLWRPETAGGPGAGEHAAPRRHWPRRAGPAVHAGGVGGGRTAVRGDSRVQVRPRPRRDGSPRRRPKRHLQPRAPPGAQHPRRGADCAGARAARQLRADVQDVRGAAGRQPRFQQAGGAADLPPVGARLANQGERGGGAEPPGDPRQAVGGARGDFRCAGLDRHDDRTGLARSALRARPDVYGIADSTPSPVQDRVARLHENARHAARRRPRFHLDGHLRPASGRDGVGEPRARAVGTAGGGHRQVDPACTPRAPGAKSSAWSATCATTGSTRRPRLSRTGR